MTTTELPPQDEAVSERPAVDPRFRARWIACRREEGRRRLRRLTRLAILLAVVVGGWLATRSPLLDVDRIEVRGAERAQPDDVRAASGVRMGQAMTDVDTRAVVAGVEAVPWVAEADVERHWPNRITITITERTAVGVLAGSDGSWWAVDADGRLLERLADSSGAVAIEGATSDERPLRAGDELEGSGRRAVQVATLLPAQVRAATAAVVLDGRDLSLRLAGEGAGIVRLGRGEELPAKLLAVASVLSALEPACIQVLDVRVPTAPVLTEVPRCG